MTRRAGKTIKLSISVTREDAAVLKRAAHAEHEGNLSAVIAQAAKFLRQREAQRRLIETLGGPTLTPEAAAAIDAEWAGGPRYVPKKRKAAKRRRAA